MVTEPLHNMFDLKKLLHSAENTYSDSNQIIDDMSYEMAENGKQRIKDMISGRFKNLQKVLNMENKELGFLKNRENLVCSHNVHCI